MNKHHTLTITVTGEERKELDARIDGTEYTSMAQYLKHIVMTYPRYMADLNRAHETIAHQAKEAEIVQRGTDQTLESFRTIIENLDGLREELKQETQDRRDAQKERHDALTIAQKRAEDVKQIAISLGVTDTVQMCQQRAAELLRENEVLRDELEDTQSALKEMAAKSDNQTVVYQALHEDYMQLHTWATNPLLVIFWRRLKRMLTPKYQLEQEQRQKEARQYSPNTEGTGEKK